MSVLLCLRELCVCYFDIHLSRPHNSKRSPLTLMDRTRTRAHKYYLIENYDDVDVDFFSSFYFIWF